MLSFDIIQHITDFCDTLTSLRINGLSKTTHEKIKIKHITKLNYNLTDKILEHKKYDPVILNTSWNPRITKISHMSQLKILIAGGYCGIDYNQIKCLNLDKLTAASNPKIEKSFDKRNNLIYPP